MLFISSFWSIRKNGLIRNIRLIPKFMTSQPINKQLQYTYYSISHKVNANGR